MGCDIHGWIEVKVDGKYVAVKELKDDSRNYERFAALAGVRGEGPAAKGIPNDLSDTVKYNIEEWGQDGHSHSYLLLEDAAKIFLETARNPSEYAKKYPESNFFDWESSAKGVRLVFWFDN